MKGLRIGIIGTGGIARGHGKRLRTMEGVEIAAVVDPSEESLARFTEAVFDGNGRPPAYSGHREMLEKEKLDAVLVCTPHTLHFDQIMESLDAGLHVLSEKPLVCTEDETHRVIERAGEARRHVMVSFQRRFRGAYRAMKKLLHDSDFGNVNFVSAYISQGWLTSQADKWRQKKSLSGGGQLNDTGAHIIDMMMWLLEDEATDLSAFIKNYGCEVDIDSAISFRTRKGTLGTLSVVGSAPRRTMWEEITMSGDNGRAMYLSQGKLTVAKGHGEGLEQVELSGEDLNPDRHFIEVITGRTRNESPPEDFLRNIRFTEAAWKSAEEGGRVVRIGA
jgi:predicted dehydrogenase